MRTRYDLYLLLFLCLLSVYCTEDANAGAPAQADNAATASPPIQVPSNASAAAEGLIKLDVVVTDNYSGMPVSGLKFKDFSLLDNGQPQKIVSFHGFDEFSAKPDPPIEVILVIDTLQMPPALVSHQRTSIEAFLREHDGHLALPVSIFELAESGLWRMAATSTDGNALASRVAHNSQAALVRAARGGQLGDVPASMDVKDPPSLEALKELGEIATEERRKPGRKLLLWIGPGSGMGSGAYAEGISSKVETFYAIRWFSTLLREARITLYSVAVGENDSRAQFYKDYLRGVESDQEASFMNLYRKVLAVQSGGRVMDQSEDVVRLIDNCVREASIFYSLSFDPPSAEHLDEYHDLKVQIDKVGVTAHTNTGYYDEPYYSDRSNSLVKRVTVEELEKLLEADRSEQDAEVARQLFSLKLTERMGTEKLASSLTGLRGKKSRQALIVLADESAFLDPPSADVPDDAPPDAVTQKKMLSMAQDYLEKIIPKLPNFFATRTTLHYQETAQFYRGTTSIDYEPLHLAYSTRATVFYRSGREVADAGELQHRKLKATDPNLTTYGTFGPVLGFVHDAVAFAEGVTWDHWEKNAHGVRAVFLYRIPAEKSLYPLYGCCLPDGEGTSGFQTLVAYHGEIAIDPVSGAILRLNAVAELKDFTPVDRSEIVVEYGPVDIGGKIYVCPVRSVSLMRMRSVSTLGEWDESFKTYGPYGTVMNDIAYDGYHIFRGESRLLTGVNPAR